MGFCLESVLDSMAKSNYNPPPIDLNDATSLTLILCWKAESQITSIEIGLTNSPCLQSARKVWILGKDSALVPHRIFHIGKTQRVNIPFIFPILLACLPIVCEEEARDKWKVVSLQIRQDRVSSLLQWKHTLYKSCVHKMKGDFQ